jgi:hypothetical protein
MTSNYDIHYVTDATCVINQLPINVTAATDTKTYDANTTSDGVPVVDVLASGDVVNAAPTQTYDNKNVGTTHVMTPAGLTIMDALEANMTANYDIHYVTDATGVINQLPINVTAATDTKTYDANTTSDGVPVVDVLASGDVVNAAPTQTFDTRMVGTGKTMTPAGLTIKDALDANMTANYDIHYVTDVTGIITVATISATDIAGVTPPVAGATPVSTVISGTGYTGTVTWSPAVATYGYSTIYTATITLTATAGYTFTGVTANQFKIAGSSPTATNSANSGVITSAFPATGAAPPPPPPPPPVVNPVPAISGESGPVCEGTIGLVYTTEANMTNYIWTISDGGTITSGGTSTSSSVSVTWTKPGNQTVRVNYTNGSGRTATTATEKVVVVDAAPIPLISGQATVCAASSGHVYTTETGMTGYSWSVSAGGTITAGGTSTDATCTVTWNVAGPQTIGVIYTNANGCSATNLAIRNVTVVALTAPVVSGPSSVCEGSLGNVYTTESGMTNYTWSISAGGVITSGAGTKSVRVNWNTSGARTIGVRYVNAGGCSETGTTTKNVTVNAVITPAIAGSGEVCAGTAGVKYTTQPGMESYAWTVSSGGQITGGAGTNVLTVTWSGVGVQTVGVKYNNPAGCPSELSTLMNLIVHPLPVPSIGGSITACAGTTGVTYVTEPGMTAYVWSISLGGTITSGAGTSTVTVSWNTAGSQSVGVNYTNAKGCSAAQPTTLGVTVNPLPGTAGAITGTTTICGGTQGVVYSIAPIANASGYTWSVPTGATIVSGVGTTSITVNYAANATSGAVSVYASNGCGNSNTSSVSVNVTPLPAWAGTISGNSSVCQGSTGLIYSVTPIAGATGYTWSVPSGATIVSGANTSSIVLDLPVGTTTGQITVYGSNSCGKGAVSAIFILTVKDLPSVPVVSASGSNISSSASQGNQWYFSDTASGSGTAISGATAQTYAPTQDGWYWTQVTSNGCISDLSNRLYRLKPGEPNIYNVYPVPNLGEFTISITTPEEQVFSILIHNQLGQKVYEISNLVINGAYQQVINLLPASTGIYTLTFRNKDGNVVKKFTVNK